jgi:hypothetical protein
MSVLLDFSLQYGIMRVMVRPGKERVMTFRVWYRDGSARLVTARDTQEARAEGKALAEVDALDISDGYKVAKQNNPDRAKELLNEYLGRTVVTKVESL